MHSPELLYDIMRYGMAVSALMLALVLWGYGRGGAGRGYGLLSLAMVLVALRHFSLMVLDGFAVVLWLVDFEPALRSALIISGLLRFSARRFPDFAFLIDLKSTRLNSSHVKNS